MKKLIGAFVLILVCASAGYSQILDPVKWSFSLKHVKGNNYQVVAKAKIDKGFYVYSQHIEDGGPIPTSITYEGEKGFKVKSKFIETGEKKSGFDKMFNMKIVKFKKTFTLTQDIVVTDKSKPIKGYLEYMTCDDEQCLPPDEVPFNLKVK